MVGLNSLKRKAIYLTYRVMQGLLFPAVILYLLVRCLRDRTYLGTLRERFGELPPVFRRTTTGAIWLHAVSVGEVLVAIPLIQELLIRRPEAHIFLSTTTPAGRAIADKRLKGVVDGIFYAPLDLVWVVRKVLRWIRPSVLVVLETEIWPNMFREAKRLGCGLAIVNGRISDRALPKYRKRAGLFGQVLGLCDVVLAQSDLMRQRWIAAGTPPDRCRNGGNLKYDFTPGTVAADSPALRFLGAADANVWIAASTCSDGQIDEEDHVLAAQRLLPGWRLILAPRHPDRFESVARKLEASGLRWTRRSNPHDDGADILLLDSIGELGGLFAHADAVFMGGTLAQKGGHNVLEPAVFAKPIVCGPHLENFPDIEIQFRANNALLRIGSGDQLAGAIASAAADTALGLRALESANAQRGAAATAASAVMDLYDTCYPQERPPQPGYAFLWLFERLWIFFSARDRRKKQARVRKLPIPVLSVGNLTAGGTGKTPVSIELLRYLRHDGAAMLTRGHGRGTGGTVLLPRGDESVPLALTGDEAQLYLRTFARNTPVPMGIASERYEAGIALLAQANPRMFLLDDGFQHLQLARDFDLVLVDGLHPFGGGRLLPMGRLREPLSGLARASAILITRENEAPNIPAIEYQIRRWNQRAPIFHCRTVVDRWTNLSGSALPIPKVARLRSVAICGLGNPAAFWKSLDQVGVKPMERYEFGDHHRYKPVEIRRLARRTLDLGAEVILTTAKDAVNMPAEVESIIAPLKLCWLEIKVEIDRTDELLVLIRAALFPGADSPPTSDYNTV